ncbi:MAG TPA: hypothetical protein VK427_25610 [Kofleriaceae bacterium]|nr:hypothetical protein [Kofleriaceae bacterium]
MTSPAAGSPTPAVITQKPTQPEAFRPLPYQTAPDLPPEVFAPELTKVAVGQTVSFSVAAIDQNLDETRVDVIAAPPSAKFDALTQTVTWTPTKADVPKGDLRARDLAAGSQQDGEEDVVGSRSCTRRASAQQQDVPRHGDEATSRSCRAGEGFKRVMSERPEMSQAILAELVKRMRGMMSLGPTPTLSSPAIAIPKN